MIVSPPNSRRAPICICRDENAKLLLVTVPNDELELAVGITSPLASFMLPMM
jgi:hypothetical protein